MIWKRFQKDIYVCKTTVDLGVASAVISFNDSSTGTLKVLKGIVTILFLWIVSLFLFFIFFVAFFFFGLFCFVIVIFAFCFVPTLFIDFLKLKNILHVSFFPNVNEFFFILFRKFRKFNCVICSTISTSSNNISTNVIICSTISINIICSTIRIASISSAVPSASILSAVPSATVSTAVPPATISAEPSASYQDFLRYRSQHPGPISQRAFYRSSQYGGDDPSFRWRRQAPYDTTGRRRGAGKRFNSFNFYQ
ncbi:uncharacterized protein LOC124814124 [Hydra vulgaris]|uniref:uncharacterized protein LOC124814124 n=1 Tax=Hydra vulgaris TaxID=6087 RepID=UPI0032EA3D8A